MIDERRIKILGITFLMLMNLAAGYMFEGGDALVFFLRFFTVLLMTIIQWEVAHTVLKHLRRRFPQRTQIKKRIGQTLGCFFFISVAIQLMGDYIIDYLIDQKELWSDPLRFVNIVLQALMFSLTTICMFEVVYYYNNFNKSELEKEALLRTNLQSQLDSLKGQVSPHFLFNSLNSLSSLISKDPEKAELFVEELSSVYRYLLRSNEQQLITLEAEMEFIQSYLLLLNTRFSNNLRVTINVAKKYEDYLLPPLTLQLLVENAVKHNIVSSEQPLDLHLFTTESDRLHVVNKLQRKTTYVFSNKIGLTNIASKYHLLKQPDIEIKETESSFAVILPLIQPEEYDYIKQELMPYTAPL